MRNQLEMVREIIKRHTENPVLKLSDADRVICIETALAIDRMECGIEFRKGLCLTLKTTDLKDFCSSIQVMWRCYGNHMSAQSKN